MVLRCKNRCSSHEFHFNKFQICCYPGTPQPCYSHPVYVPNGSYDFLFRTVPGLIIMTKPMPVKTGKSHMAKAEKKTKGGGVKKIAGESSKLKNAIEYGMGTVSGISGGGGGTRVGVTPKTSSFHSEIAGMMYAFGDSRKPLASSVMLVEDIVHQQMTAVLVQTIEVSEISCVEVFLTK